MTLDEYQRRAFATAKIDWSDPSARHIPVFGVIGELGSLASEIKKRLRDGEAYTDGIANVTEEVGDLLWYVGALATHHGFKLSSLDTGIQRSRGPLKGFDHVYTMVDAFADLVAQCNRIMTDGTPTRKRRFRDALTRALRSVLHTIHRERLDLDKVLRVNLRKVGSMFGPQVRRPAPCHDGGFPDYERLPRQTNIQFIERDRGHRRLEVILRVGGLNFGDRLTDNAATDDGYRYHDAFHLAYAAVLGWSPVVRATFRCKRKSDPRTDEVQDGARAAIVEEAVAQMIFHYARGHSMLRGLDRVDPGILKLVRRMVRGLEVERAALHDWQRAIFVGFDAFRALKRARGGWLVLDAERQNLTFSKILPGRTGDGIAVDSII